MTFITELDQAISSHVPSYSILMKSLIATVIQQKSQSERALKVVKEYTETEWEKMRMEKHL